MTETGIKYIDDKVGDGIIPSSESHEVVQLHYTVTVLSSGAVLGTSRGGQPVTFALAKHDVPIWDEALVGMRIGGKRRMIVPPKFIPDTQKNRVPGGDRELRFDFELLGVLEKTHPMALIASAIPPGNRRFVISQQLYAFLFALSFVPYFLPTNLQPSWYHDGKPREQIIEDRIDRMNARYLGSDLNGMRSLDELFPPEDALP